MRVKTIKNLKKLTDKQLERQLNKAYNSSNYEIVNLIEDEQRTRYSLWLDAILDTLGNAEDKHWKDVATYNERNSH
jgi:hypothetical protein|tara:strand:+ start:496 stop:723 length:228 start_codon:yes stop_codon:yes gene_type:complete